MTDYAALVRRALDPATATEFDRRVRRQADRLVAAVEDGAFDNDAYTLGLELEAYAVDEHGRLAAVPDDVFAGPAAKELGVHDVELNADAAPFDADGLAAQAEGLAADLAATRERLAEHDLDLVLDSMWTVPPAEGGHAYLDDIAVEGGDAEDRAAAEGPGGAPVVPGPGADDPVVVARNMRRDPRYGALDNAAVRRAGGAIEFDPPGANLAFRTILFESLATSVQPHVQVPDAEAFPRYHNYAVRTLGPVLALTTNSPFLPADCYDADPGTVVAETDHELRVAAFEGAMNQGCRKVGVPDDLERATDVVEHVVADETYGPFLEEWGEEETGADGPDDGADESDRGAGDGPVAIENCWEYDYKRGSFWRWVRGVACGSTVAGACDERSLRVEYRPVPTQPTVRDNVAVQALTAGLLRGLDAADHPLEELRWDAAERSFYAAVADGPAADLAWVTADGERTDDAETIVAEVFEFARRGLAEQGVPADERDRHLAPIEARWERGVTPSVWKVRQVREALDEGADFADALARMQREYARLSRERETFADWLD